MHNLTIDASGFFYSHETATVVVQSPTGKKVDIRKCRIWKANDAQKAVWRKVTEKANDCKHYTIQATRSEMVAILELSKL